MTVSTDGTRADARGPVRRVRDQARERLRGHELRTYVWSICGSGGLLFLAMLAVTLGSPSASVPGWRLVLVAALALGADRSLLEIRFGANNESFTWAEVCVVLGLYLIPLPLLIVLNTTGVLLYHVLKRTHPLKAMFN